MQKQINNFSITVSTVNGSGSATANNTIHKAIFKMGIPVVGRNIFPSNIQGLPTWYSIRVSEKGYLGRSEKDNIVICLNRTVIEKDIQRLSEGGILIVDQNIDIPETGKNISKIILPIDEILKVCEVPSKLKIYLANMVYVGVLAHLIQIDLKAIEESLKQHFNNRIKAVSPNMEVINASYAWASKNIDKGFASFVLEKREITDNIIIDGNTAAALGALYGGLQFTAWYPITPATGIAESINEYIPQLRFDHQKQETTSVVVQAEDELASIGMVIGAGWAGLRSMTATSGPGLCLMSEFLGLAYFVEVPIVVWDVQRVGPSTGLPTRTSQGDLEFVYSMSHGDTDFIILLPSSVKECFEFGWKALDLAEHYQMPVIVLSDLELGMNIWISEPFEYPDQEIDRGKVLWEDDLEKIIINGQAWGRYLDIDGDGIPHRTLPGNLHSRAAYFARGTGHDAFAHYSEDPAEWKNNLDRLKRKYESASQLVPAPVIKSGSEKSKIAIISYGSTDFAVREVIDTFKGEGTGIDYMRIRALPFNKHIEEFISEHEKVFIVECNRDGQMKSILTQEFPEYAHRIIPIAKIDGLSLTAKWINDEMKKYIG